MKKSITRHVITKNGIEPALPASDANESNRSHLLEHNGRVYSLRAVRSTKSREPIGWVPVWIPQSFDELKELNFEAVRDAVVSQNAIRLQARARSAVGGKVDPLTAMKWAIDGKFVNPVDFRDFNELTEACVSLYNEEHESVLDGSKLWTEFL